MTRLEHASSRIANLSPEPCFTRSMPLQSALKIVVVAAADSRRYFCLQSADRFALKPARLLFEDAGEKALAHRVCLALAHNKKASRLKSKFMGRRRSPLTEVK